MILFLILGVILGAAAVFFILQNTAFVTVTFLSWQFGSPLSIVLILTLLSGVVITLLIILPSLIRDAYYLSKLSNQKAKLEGELAQTKNVLAEVSLRLNHPDVVVVEHKQQ